MEKSIKHLFLIFIFLTVSLNALEVQTLAKELNLYAGTKASIQWERIFSSPRRLEQYKLNHLSPTKRNALQIYLIHHAADSEQPIVPGL